MVAIRLARFVCQLAERIASDFKCPVGKLNLDGCRFAYNIVFKHGACAVGGYNILAHARHYLVHCLVACLLKF